MKNSFCNEVNEEVARSCTVTFRHGGEIIGTERVPFGELPVFRGEVPALEGYYFGGFTNTDQPVRGDTICDAFFTVYDPEQLRWALARDDMSFQADGYNDNRGEVFEEASAVLLLLLELRHTPFANAFTERLKAKIVGSMKYFMGEEGVAPMFSLDPHWCYVPLSAFVLLARETPEIWNELTSLEREKYDFLMTSLAYILNYGTSDRNCYTTGPGFRAQFHKYWNPNYRLSCVLPMIFIGKYFGGADRLDALLMDFSYDATVAKFKEYGWRNAVKEWTTTPPTFEGVQAPSQKETMEHGGTTFLVDRDGKQVFGKGVGVRTPYRWYGATCDQIVEIVKNVFEFSYSGGKVISGRICTYNDITEPAYILDGTKSPYEGLDGMMLEMGRENRSSTKYGRHDFVMSCAALSVFNELRLYDIETDGQKDRLFQKLWVGNMDYLYKIAHGYMSFQNSSWPYNEPCYEIDKSAHFLWKSWWLQTYGNRFTIEALAQQGE